MTSLCPSTVITIPTYNREALIGRAIQSVLNQTSGGWELLVFDDGSTDGTQGVVEGYKDDRIIYHRRAENKGLVYTFNEMLDRVIEMGVKYWSWLASDDELSPFFLETHVRKLEETQAAATWSDFVTERDGRHQRVCMAIEPVHIRETLKKRVCVSLASMCTTVSILKEVKARYGEFCSSEYMNMNDWDFLIKFASVTDKFHYIPEALSTYHIHKDAGSEGVYFGSATNESAKQFLVDRAKMMAKF
jgi:glycosyltransferase involved in cell wall biosynthesis